MSHKFNILLIDGPMLKDIRRDALINVIKELHEKDQIKALTLCSANEKWKESLLADCQKISQDSKLSDFIENSHSHIISHSTAEELDSSRNSYFAKWCTKHDTNQFEDEKMVAVNFSLPLNLKEINGAPPHNFYCLLLECIGWRNPTGSSKANNSPTYFPGTVVATLRGAMLTEFFAIIADSTSLSPSDLESKLKNLGIVADLNSYHNLQVTIQTAKGE